MNKFAELFKNVRFVARAKALLSSRDRIESDTWNEFVASFGEAYSLEDGMIWDILPEIGLMPELRFAEIMAAFGYKHTRRRGFLKSMPSRIGRVTLAVTTAGGDVPTGWPVTLFLYDDNQKPAARSDGYVDIIEIEMAEYRIQAMYRGVFS